MVETINESLVVNPIRISPDVKLDINLQENCAYLYLSRARRVDVTKELDSKTLVDYRKDRPAGVDFLGVSQGLRTDFLPIGNELRDSLNMVLAQIGIPVRTS